jgi:hypothetical protein
MLLTTPLESLALNLLSSAVLLTTVLPKYRVTFDDATKFAPVAVISIPATPCVGLKVKVGAGKTLSVVVAKSVVQSTLIW